MGRSQVLYIVCLGELGFQYVDLSNGGPNKEIVVNVGNYYNLINSTVVGGYITGKRAVA